MAIRIVTVVIVSTAFLLAQGAVPALAAKKVIIKVGHMYSNKNPTHYGAIHFGKRLEKLSKGTMEVQVFLKGQVGDGKAQLQSVQLGAIQATFQGLTQFPPFDSLNLPYFWKSTKHVRTVANGPLFDRWRKEFLKKRGTQMVSVINRGARHVLSRKKPLKTLADFKGLKIRVPQAPPWVLAFRALGAKPTPMSWADVYNAMLLGTVDAMENTLETLYTNKFYEVGKHLTLTSHLSSTSYFMVNDKWHKGLSKGQRKWFDQALSEGIAHAQKIYTDLENAYLDKFKKKGIKIYNINVNEFARKTASAAETIGVKGWGKAFFNELKKTRAQF